MPYRIEKRGPIWVVLKGSKVKSRHGSRVNAERQVRLLRGVEHGWKPTGKRARR